MAKIYTKLTDMLDEMQQDKFGEWIHDYENDGCPEHPIHMSFVAYSELVKAFEAAVYCFEKEHPEYGLNRYIEILEKHRIEQGIESIEYIDVSDMDGQGVMALLLGAIRAERFGNGVLLRFFENGLIQKWILRLREIDEGNGIL